MAQVWHKLNCSETLLIFLLKGARPEKYRERYDVASKVETKIDQPPVVVALSEVLTLDEAKRLKDRMIANSAKGLTNGHVPSADQPQ